MHEDIDGFGLGCESLMTSYAQKSSSLLVESLRDIGRMGTVTKAMLVMQLKHLGDPRASPHQYKYSMRVRQLGQITANDLTLVNDEIPQFAQHPDIVRALTQLNPQNSTHPWRVPCDFLQPLFKLDIFSLGDLLEPDGKHIINGRTLKHKKGKLVRAKHITALNRLATLLNESPGHDNDVRSLLRHKNTNPLLDRNLRQIHPLNMHITARATNDLPDVTLFPAPHQDQRLITEYIQRGQETTLRRQTTQLSPNEQTKTPDLMDRGTKRAASKNRNHTHNAQKQSTKKRLASPGRSYTSSNTSPMPL